MELSILVARILAVTYLSAGLGAVTGRISFDEIMKDFERSPGLAFLSGFFTAALGVILVTYHNRWDGGWPVVITVIGWLSLVKGVLLMAFPKVWISFKKNYAITKAWGFPLIALGIVFGYFGFML